MASGLVPMTSLTSAKCSLPPTSAGGSCLHYGRSSTEIVGVGLDLHPHGRGGGAGGGEPVFFAESDGALFGGKFHPHWGFGAAGPVPPGERVRPQRLPPF